MTSKKAEPKKPEEKAPVATAPNTSVPNTSVTAASNEKTTVKAEALPELTNGDVARAIGGKILVAEYPEGGKRKVTQRSVRAEHILSHTLTGNKLVAVLVDGSKRVLERS